MISSMITRASAVLLLVCGLALLFAPDEIMPALAPGFPPSAAWFAQMLGAAWLGVAALNWSQRSKLIGGIYGRPMVYTNFILFFVGGLSMLKAWQAPGAPRMLGFAAAPVLLLAVGYGVLLFRGPLDQPRARE